MPPAAELAAPLMGNRLGDMFRRSPSSLSAFPLGFRVDRERVSALPDEDIAIEVDGSLKIASLSVEGARSASSQVDFL